jgi:hypothetical protein
MGLGGTLALTTPPDRQLASAMTSSRTQSRSAEASESGRLLRGSFAESRSRIRTPCGICFLASKCARNRSNFLALDAGYAGNGEERPPTEATVRTLLVLGHGRNGRDVTVVWWPGLPDVM